MIGPGLQAAVVRDLAAKIRLELLEDIQQRRRRLNAWQNREGKSVRLAGAMIGILTEYDHLRIGIARIMKCIEDRVHVRIDMMGTVFLDQELPQLTIIRLLQLRIQEFRPVIMKNLHGKHFFLYD